MAKHKYHFDIESLSFKKIQHTLKQKIIIFFQHFAVSFVMAVLLFVVFLFYFDSPKEKQLKREINLLLNQYDLMNRQMSEVTSVLQDLQQRDDNIYRTIFAAEPIPMSVRRAGFGGVNRYSKLEGYKNTAIIKETAMRLDILSKQLYIQSKSFDEVIEMARNKEKMLACIPAIQPIKNKYLTQVASGWGWRIHPIYKIRKFHYGMDFMGATGTPVYATGDGSAVEVTRSIVGLGNFIRINHGFGYETVYAHLSRFKVKEGDKVKRGDVIGYIGSTGLSTSPHLHYEVHRNGVPVNPKDYYFRDLTPAEYEKMIEISSNANLTFD
ncbi:MAG: M23 family metallopeptidase [Bacteroidia bacterium]|nr:M23 family metallopeptidase [Bacteroidia bacterium]